jgi:hypothetical protein
LTSGTILDYEKATRRKKGSQTTYRLVSVKQFIIQFMIVLSLAATCLRKGSALLCLFILLITACKEQEKKEEKAPPAGTASARFIDPPVKGVDVPYGQYDVDAAKGDILVYPTGSIIVFPPNAFVDEAGRPVTGNVQVKYREFKDPVDFFLAGIPMRYDSAGTSYLFESSGMLDIRAFKDGKPVFVNKANKPEVNLVSNTSSNKHSLYFLDTVQRKWVNKGGMVIIEGPNATNANETTAVTATDELPEPVKPVKADNKSPVLNIEVDPSSFKEFAIYKDLKFQVDESKTPFNANDSKEEWNNLELLKGDKKGVYMAKFTNTAKTVTYVVKPVFTGSDYDNAVKTFEKEYAVYKKQAAKRAVNDKAASKAYKKDSIEYEQLIAVNKRIERLNAIIDRKNREIDRQNEMTLRENKRIIDKRVLNKVYRSFEIGQFGFFNCDAVANIKDGVEVIGVFKDMAGNVLNFQNTVSVIYQSRNLIAQYFPNDKMILVPGDDITIVAALDGKLAYVSVDEYKKLNITSATKEQTFIIKIIEGADLNYDTIRRLLTP